MWFASGGQCTKSPPPAAGAAGAPPGGAAAGAADQVFRLGGAVPEFPGRQPPLLALDEQQALAREHEEVLLRPLAVVVAERLARLEHVQVQPELPEAAFALEVAVEPEVPRVVPPAVGRVGDEPPVAVRDQTVLGLPRHDLRDAHRRWRIFVPARRTSISPACGSGSRERRRSASGVWP